MTDIETLFNEARKLYPGTKRGFEVEWQNFRRRYKMNIFNHIHLIIPAIKQQIAYREACVKAKFWHADWKHFQTWINNQCWTEEQPCIKTNKPVERKCQFCGDKSTVYGDGKGPRCSRAECRIKWDLL